MSLLALQRDVMDWLRSGDPALAGRIGGGPGPDIYLNNHRASLMASLAGNYPQLRRWLGDEAFDGAAAHHVERVAPSSWTLDSYGADFPETLLLSFPDNPEVPDLARLEWRLGQTFIAPDAAPLQPSDLAEIDWDRALLRLVPSAALLPLTTNADEILHALVEDAAPPVAAAIPDGTLLIWRSDFAPRFRRPDANELPLIAMMMEGAPFADICARLAISLGDSEAVRKAGAYLARWATSGLCRHP